MAVHSIRVAPLPAWLDVRRLLGPTDADTHDWTIEAGEDGLVAHARLSSAAAADLAARLRGLGLDGRALVVDIEPSLSRAVVRQARTEDARRRRSTTPGFERAGVRVDEVGRMSLTPERIAMKVAAWAERRPIVDAGCGVGGNAIAFARAGSAVTAIELDASRLALARHNAAVYGVADRITFVHGDACELVPRCADPQAILFVDPPWGADWDRRGCSVSDLPLLASLLPLARGYAALWAKLPPSCAVAGVGDGAHLRVDALFGEAEGDRRRIKFVLVRR